MCEYVEGALYLRVFHEPVYKDNDVKTEICKDVCKDIKIAM